MELHPGNSKRLFILGALLVAGSFTGIAQSSAGMPWTTKTIDSHALGKRTIYVSTPPEYAIGTSHYPVLILLDGEDAPQFRLVIAGVSYLVDNDPGFPPLIIVGIVNGSDRIHDMTPPATGSSVKDFKNAGGASAFTSFIVDEVLPHVRQRYRTFPTTILAGHSAGGLFALDVAANRPGAFQGIISVSPALWFDDSTLVVAYSDKIVQSPVQQRIFVASGGFEKDIDVTSRQFAARMDAIKGVNVAFRYLRYPYDTHSLTPMSGFADGLRFVFEPITSARLTISDLDAGSADSAKLEAAFHSSERIFAAAAKSLGLPGDLPESVVNSLGYRLLSHHKPHLAISVFERNVRSYPGSINVYDSLGDGFLAAGDTASAVSNFRNAVAVAKQTGVPVQEETERKLEALAGH